MLTFVHEANRCNFLTRKHASRLCNDCAVIATHIALARGCRADVIATKWQAQDISYVHVHKCLVEKEAIFYFRRLYLFPLGTATCRCAWGDPKIGRTRECTILKSKWRNRDGGNMCVCGKIKREFWHSLFASWRIFLARRDSDCFEAKWMRSDSLVKMQKRFSFAVERAV